MKDTSLETLTALRRELLKAERRRSEIERLSGLLGESLQEDETPTEASPPVNRSIERRFWVGQFPDGRVWVVGRIGPKGRETARGE